MFVSVLRVCKSVRHRNLDNISNLWALSVS